MLNNQSSVEEVNLLEAKSRVERDTEEELAEGAPEGTTPAMLVSQVQYLQ